MPLSLDEFVQQLADSGLLVAEELSLFRQQLPGGSDAEQMARALVRQRRLTAFQAQQAFAGKARSLVLGNYVVLDKLGQGGMGMVLKAQHRRMNRTVALKVLSPQVTKTREVLARFQREVQAAARLEHSNIVSAYDADEVNGTYFFVMQYVDGQDLASVVKSKGPLPIRQAVGCIQQAARGLEYAHAQGVIHRDIKPANLLLDVSGTVKILDMGLARIEGEVGVHAELTSTGAVMGTVDYMAPEQAVSTKSADARSDMYSLGISLWFLLVGRPAFGGDSLMARMLAHRDAAIPSLSAALGGTGGESPQFLASLDAVFQRMVAKQPAQRYQSMTEVIAALDACLRGQTTDAPSLVATSSEDSRFNDFLAGLGSTEPNLGTSAKKSKSRSKTATATLTESDSPPTLSVTASDAITDPQSFVAVPSRKPRSSQRTANKLWWQNRTWQWVGGGLAGVFCLLAAVVLLFQTPHGTIRIESNDPAISVNIKGTELTVRGVDPQPLKVRPGQHAFVVTRGDFVFETKSLAIKRGDVVTLSLEWLADTLNVTAGGQSLGTKSLSALSPTDIVATPAITVKSPFAPADGSTDWIDLFNGSDVSLWQTLGPFRMENGLLTATAQGLAMTKDDYDDFELEFDWKIAAAGNGGVYYRNPRLFLSGAAPRGIEYQLLDNRGHPNGQNPKTQAASLYGVLAPSADRTRPVGEFNSSRIVARGSQVEHWLNGTQVLTYDSAAADFLAVAKSAEPAKRFTSSEPLRGPIALQGHTGAVSFRRIRVRPLSTAAAPATGVVNLWNGRDLTGWKGDTKGFSVRGDVLTASGSLADLITEREYADFEFTMEFRLAEGANSGFGLRYSGQGRPRTTGLEVQLVDGPNTAVDNPLERCGGLMQVLAPKVQPFRRWPEWNRLLVRCVGPQIDVELNGLTTVAANTTQLLSTFPNHVGLQRKSGSLCLITTQGRAEFRNLQIRELSSTPPARIPADAVHNAGHAYRFYPEVLTWQEAKARCEALGGHLVIIESRPENVFVAQLIEQQGGNDCWLGLTDAAQEGTWLWVNGRPPGWTNWFPSNPNNKGGAEHYGLISKELGNTKIDWQWVDQPNASTQHRPGYLCEWDTPSK